MNGSKPFNVYVGDQRYGSWYEVEGGQVKVFGAYGSKVAPTGKGDPEKVAERLLLTILADRLAVITAAP